ncbi:MADS box protein [Capsaspora owczarzaki ATCC 30864]|uniref:MADS box protein n=1 Tax=Capsaspora owczarzaki (strain ATCC 30864) TaxID=595528 RepID=A0A0D2U4R3_CAPO3|nr:MADS box protein [Capsaspora owczarzaki ATCC 30864]KJE90106.1 MADS box protein [Capsaspora owczarzaki ATCC 30864]|eukprot:XP_004364325.1 MADS box protein [Capsaspora owczarzaki ATCC 30864]
MADEYTNVNPEDGGLSDGSDDSDGDTPVRRGSGRGRRKINIEFIEDKSRRHITFSKRKAGIMKKAYELSTLTGTQVLLLVASETGHVYTFATPKLQPLITKPEGKNLIQTCLNAPDGGGIPSSAGSSGNSASAPAPQPPAPSMQGNPSMPQNNQGRAPNSGYPESYSYGTGEEDKSQMPAAYPGMHPGYYPAATAYPTYGAPGGYQQGGYTS